MIALFECKVLDLCNLNSNRQTKQNFFLKSKIMVLMFVMLNLEMVIKGGGGGLDLVLYSFVASLLPV